METKVFDTSAGRQQWGQKPEIWKYKDLEPKKSRNLKVWTSRNLAFQQSGNPGIWTSRNLAPQQSVSQGFQKLFYEFYVFLNLFVLRGVLFSFFDHCDCFLDFYVFIRVRSFYNNKTGHVSYLRSYFSFLFHFILIFNFFSFGIRMELCFCFIAKLGPWKSENLEIRKIQESGNLKIQKSWNPGIWKSRFGLYPKAPNTNTYVTRVVDFLRRACIFQREPRKLQEMGRRFHTAG